MASRGYWFGAALAAGATLLAGCKTPAADDKASTHSEAGRTPKRVATASAREPSAEEIAQAHAHYANGVLLELDEKNDAAIEEFAQAAILDPSNETLGLDVSQRYLQRNKPERAINVLTNLASRPGASGELYTQLGIAYSQLGKNELAMAAYRKAIEKSPRFFAPYQNLFLLLMQSRQPAEALKLLDRASRLSDTPPEFQLSLAELYAAFARQVPSKRDAARANALSALNRVAKQNPRNPHMRRKLADGFDLMGATDKAVPIYTNLIEFYREFPLQRSELREKLVDAYLRAGDRTNATAQLEAIVQEEPTNPKPYFYLGTLALEDEKLPSAAEYFAKATLLNPEFAQAYYDLARAQIALGKPSEALATLDKARHKTGDNYFVQFLSGLACARDKDYDGALQHYTAAEVFAQTMQPKRTNEVLFFQIGAAYERKGDIPQAERYFQKALEVSPNFEDALNYLGYMWAERGEKLDQAHALIEKAVKQDPKNPAFLDSLGWVLFKLNKPHEALDYLLKAVEYSDEPDATLYDHLGDIYAALRQPEKAAAAWRKSLSVEPSEKIQSKLGPPASE